MSNPYLFTNKTLVSFSGGRSSAYMLKKILDANGSPLPEHISVCFANTGKEHQATLDFVRDCEIHWGQKIHWLEYSRKEDKPTFVEVDYDSASRKGEPFELLIKARNFLPNPLSRFCTTELKIRTIKRYVREVLNWDYWDNAIGLRADEPRRLARVKANNDASKERWDTSAPMGIDGVTKEIVSTYWKESNFDLQLPNDNGVTYLGNCDLCFMKSMATTIRIMQEEPERAAWWIEQENNCKSENPGGRRWRSPKRYPSYAEFLEKAKATLKPIELDTDDTSMSCACTD